MALALRKYAAEGIGLLCWSSAASGAPSWPGTVIGYLGIALAFGLALLAMVYAIGPISGCHINPAVTFGLLLSRKLGARAMRAATSVAQVVGAHRGRRRCCCSSSRGAPGGYDPWHGRRLRGQRLRRNTRRAHYGLGAAFLAEVVLTFFLVFTVLGRDRCRRRRSASRACPSAWCWCSSTWSASRWTTLSVNPARSIGPALFVGGWAVAQLWLFIVAPLLGGASRPPPTVRCGSRPR